MAATAMTCSAQLTDLGTLSAVLCQALQLFLNFDFFLVRACVFACVCACGCVYVGVCMVDIVCLFIYIFQQVFVLEIVVGRGRFFKILKPPSEFTHIK